MWLATFEMREPCSIIFGRSSPVGVQGLGMRLTRTNFISGTMTK